jgi:hypothetical protein
VVRIVKVVGFDARNADDLVVLLDAKSAPLGVLPLQRGKIDPLVYDGKSDVERCMLAHNRGQERIYGDTRVYLRTDTNRGLSRTIEWADVYLRQGNLSRRPSIVAAANRWHVAKEKFCRDRAS